ncbi:MAG: glycosyltransferase family 4 protein [Candidatus Dormibacteria bacterium]
MLAAMAVHIVLALALMPVAGQPYDLASLTGAGEAWARWGFPLLYNWKFGFDLSLLAVGAEAVRSTLEQFGMSGAAALATAWKLPLVASDLVVGVILLDIGRRVQVRRPSLIPTLWLLSPVSLWVSAGHGQVESLMVLSLVGAVDLMLRGRSGLAGAVAGLGVGIEYLPAGVVLVVALWFYSSVLRPRDVLSFVAGFAAALAACFGPALLSQVGRASLFSGLTTTVAVTTQSGQSAGAPAAGSSSLWAVFGLSPGAAWTAVAAVVGALMLVFLARRSVREPSRLQRERLGVAAAGGLLLCIVLLDPGALPQFADLALAGLCLLGLVVDLNPLIIVAGPLLQLAGGFFYVYGGSFQSYWYDMWYKTGNPGWVFPQSAVVANICERLGALLIVAGVLWVATSTALPRVARLRSRHHHRWIRWSWVGVAALVGVLGSAFLASWSLQPAFWLEVGSGGPAALADFASLTATRSGQVTDRGAVAVVSFAPVLVQATHESAVGPSMSLTLAAPPILQSTTATAPREMVGRSQRVTIPNWSERRASLRSLWVSLLVGRSVWSTAALASAQAPSLHVGDRVIRARGVTWLVHGWAVANYAIPAWLVSSAGVLDLRLSGASSTASPLLWNGSRSHRWIVVDLRSGEATARIDGNLWRRQVRSPAPTVGLFHTELVTLSRLPMHPTSDVRDASLGGTAARVTATALVWPTTTPIARGASGLALFELGLLWLLVVIGTVALLLRTAAPPGAVPPPSGARRRPGGLSRPDQRVVVMTTRYPLAYPGGVERVAHVLAGRLGASGEPWVARHVAAFGGRRGVARVPILGDLVASVALAFRSLGGADVLMVHGAEYAWACRVVAWLQHRPLVVVWHGVRGCEALPPPRGVLDRVGQAAFTWASDRLQRAALGAGWLVAVSPGVADEVRQRFKFQGPVEVIVNGVELARDRSRRSAEAGNGTSRRGYSSQRRALPLRVIWVGTTPFKKGFDIALGACDAARDAGADLTLTVVGSSRERAGQLRGSVPSWVSWLGPVPPDQMKQLLESHQVLLCPARYEACSVAVIEAMAAGLPVVGSQAVAWQVQGAGEIVATGDPDDYARALQRMLDPKRRRRLAVAARSRARDFSWTVAVVGYRRLLDRSLGMAGNDASQSVAHARGRGAAAPRGSALDE